MLNWFLQQMRRKNALSSNETLKSEAVLKGENNTALVASDNPYKTFLWVHLLRNIIVELFIFLLWVICFMF